MHFPCLFIYNTSSVHSRPAEVFPKKTPMIVCSLQLLVSIRETTSLCSTSTFFSDLESTQSLQNAVISNIERPTKKLTLPKSRRPLRSIDKSVHVISYIVELLFRQGASVINPYSGTVTTSLAHLGELSSSVVIERYSTCF